MWRLIVGVRVHPHHAERVRQPVPRQCGVDRAHPPPSLAKPVGVEPRAHASRLRPTAPFQPISSVPRRAALPGAPCAPIDALVRCGRARACAILGWRRVFGQERARGDEELGLPVLRAAMYSVVTLRCVLLAVRTTASDTAAKVAAGGADAPLRATARTSALGLSARLTGRGIWHAAAQSDGCNYSGVAGALEHRVRARGGAAGGRFAATACAPPPPFRHHEPPFLTGDGTGP